MANKGMSQDRRDAMRWAEEWRIKQRNKRILYIVLGVVAVAVLAAVISYVSVMVSRTTYGSAEEMRAALQGRYETDYAEDIVIEDEKVTLTYYNQSHYDLEYAETYGYSEYEDSVYEDEVVEWDYRHGQVKLKWMDTLKVDKQGNLIYYNQVFEKTDNPPPTPLDPSELSIYKKAYEDARNAEGAAAAEGSAETETDAAAEAGSETPELTEEEQAAQEAVQESQLETQAAASEAGVDAGAEAVPEEGTNE